MIAGTPLFDVDFIAQQPVPDVNFDDYLKGLYEKEKRGEIGPLSAIKDAPIYQFKGGLDYDVSSQWTKTMRDIFITLGAKVKFETGELFGHMFPHDVGAYVNKHIYDNLPESGFTKWSPYNNEPDSNWKSDGYMGKFD